MAILTGMLGTPLFFNLYLTLEDLMNRYILNKLKKITYYFPLFLIAFLLISCSSNTFYDKYPTKDNKRRVWTQKNSRIRHFIGKFKRGRHVKISLERAQKYLPTIHEEFAKYRLPPELAYLPILESGFDTDADSGRAVGLWQFTEATAEDYGLSCGWLGFMDERRDWKKSTEAAARYLNVLGKRFNYNWELALAAYNAGPNYIKKQMKRQKTWNFWRLKLRKETREYVPKFFAILHVARSRYPNLYGPSMLLASK